MANADRNAALAIMVLLLTACGGGGGGGDNFRPDAGGTATQSSPSSPSVRIPENSDGSGVVVAVLDSGVRAGHVEFDHGARVLSGYNVAEGNADFSDPDGASHGTRVASVALGSTLGVAPGATLLPVRIINVDGTFTTSEIAAGIDYARSRQAPVNNISATVYDTASIRNAVEASAAAGILTVAAAGNNSHAEPIPAPLLGNVSANAVAHFLVVGAVDGDDRITAWSDRAGTAKERYLVARGTSVPAALNTGDDDYGTASGTSFSSPQVAGAAALVKGADPALSMREVAEILLRSADDLGAPGVDAVFGWGKLNPTRALAPIGTLAIPDRDQAGGSAAPVSATSLRLGSAFGDALRDAPQLSGVVALDAYRRPYRVDARNALHRDTGRLALGDRLLAASRNREHVDADLAGIRLRGSWQSGRRHWAGDGGAWDEPEPETSDRALALTGRVAAVDWEYTSGVAPASRFGVGALQPFQQLPWLLGDGPGDDYLSLVDTDHAGLALATGVDRGMDFRIGLFEGRNGRAADERAVQAGLAEAGYQLGPLQLRMTASQIHEQRGILGSAGDGALATGLRSLTDSLGVAGQWRLGSHTALVAHYQWGRTRVDAADAGLLRDWSTIYSDAWGVGAVRQGLFRSDDFLGLSYRRPLRVSRGSVLVDAPVHRDLRYGIERSRSRAGLAPSGVEQDLELVYGFGAGESRFSAGLLYRLEPGHIADADPDLAAMVGIRRPF